MPISEHGGSKSDFI
ncbi:uncharacterized protein FFMR_15839 [Fusarium fujikuroi]|nr:uncharacterized protein FFMR_15839 [Fusarium fujikuroi]